MKLEIYHEEKEIVVVEEPVRLRLKRVPGGVELVVVNKDGGVTCGGYLLIIRLNGTIKRWANVGPKLGFQLDDNNRIVETD